MQPEKVGGGQLPGIGCHWSTPDRTDGALQGAKEQGGQWASDNEATTNIGAMELDGCTEPHVWIEASRPPAELFIGESERSKEHSDDNLIR
jgi:hypothetical protein